MNDSTLADVLLTSHPESLDDKSPDGYAGLPLEDKCHFQKTTAPFIRSRLHFRRDSTVGRNRAEEVRSGR